MLNEFATAIYQKQQNLIPNRPQVSLPLDEEIINCLSSTGEVIKDSVRYLLVFDDPMSEWMVPPPVFS